MRDGISGKLSPAFLWTCYWKPPQAFMVVCLKSQMRIFALPWITNAAVSHYTRMNMAHRDPQKTLCFFILPVLGGFKHLLERLQLVKCNGCSFLWICFDGKYCKSSQKLQMMQYQVSNPSWMLLLVDNFTGISWTWESSCATTNAQGLALKSTSHHPHLSFA